jgi:hypothetical protein
MVDPSWPSSRATPLADVLPVDAGYAPFGYWLPTVCIEFPEKDGFDVELHCGVIDHAPVNIQLANGAANDDAGD